MYGQTELSAMLHDPSITALLSDPGYIWNTEKMPDKGPGKKTINYYRSTPVGPNDWLDINYSVNCRAPKEADADEIARQVRNVLNRYSSGSVFFTASVLSPIRPQDTTDNFNVPVEITVKGPDV